MAKARNFKPDSPKRRPRKSQLDKLEEQSPLTGTASPYKQNEDGSVDVDIDGLDKPESPEDEKQESEWFENLVDELDADQLNLIGTDVKKRYDAHKASRYDWEQMIETGSQLLGLKLEEKNTPFRGACSAHHPLLIESAVKFQSKASNELLPANGPVKIKVLGEVTSDRELQANRVASHMNYQITEQMTEFYIDSERMLLHVPLFGSGFKKTYYSEKEERPVSEFVPADQLVVPNNVSDLHRAECYTHVLYKTRNELEADFASGFYEKPELPLVPSSLKLSPIQQALNSISGVEVSTGEAGDGFTLYEQHVMIYIEDLDDEDDGEFEIAKPYIITVDAETSAVLGIRRNWNEEDKKRTKLVPFVHYMFVPGFGFYGFGFLHLLGNIQLSLTSSLRSLIDAGQFATLQGGFKLKGVRIINDGEPIYPGQFKEVDSGVLDINKSIMRLPFGEPSQTLFQMLEWLDMKGQKFADATEQIIGDATNYGPVGTTLALLDASTKFFTAIHKRLHNSLKEELKLIAVINSKTLPDDLEYNIEAATMAISKKDYDETMDIVPVSDPNVSSNAHRMAKAQTMLQVAQTSPQLHDMREVLKHFYSAMDYGNVDKILPQPQQAQPQDPLTDLQSAVQGQPISAFQGQDHKSYIAIFQAFLGDPNSGQSHLMQKAAQQVAAASQQHMILMFSEQVQAQAAMMMQQMAARGPIPPQQAQQMQQQVQAQAAQQVAMLNQQQLQQQMEQQQQTIKDQAAMILAQAEMMDTQTKARKQAFEEKAQSTQLALKNKDLDIKSTALHMKDSHFKQTQDLKDQHFDKKLVAQHTDMVVSKGLDAMTEGLQQKDPPKETKNAGQE